MEYQVLYTRVSTLAEDALTFTAGYASVTAAAPLAVALPRVPTTNVPQPLSALARSTLVWSLL